jgi:hypothetical protein
MNHEAIYALYPTVLSVDANGIARNASGNVVSYDLAAVTAWVKPSDYKLERLIAYPSLGDQLDMLWHAIDTNSLNKTSDFYTAIKAVKDAHPKG